LVVYPPWKLVETRTELDRKLWHDWEVPGGEYIVIMENYVNVINQVQKVHIIKIITLADCKLYNAEQVNISLSQREGLRAPRCAQSGISPYCKGRVEIVDQIVN